jgi:hypothetical protein
VPAVAAQQLPRPADLPQRGKPLAASAGQRALTPLLLCMGLFSTFYFGTFECTRKKKKPDLANEAGPCRLATSSKDQPRVRERIMKLS